MKFFVFLLVFGGLFFCSFFASGVGAFFGPFLTPSMFHFLLIRSVIKPDPREHVRVFRSHGSQVGGLPYEFCIIYTILLYVWGKAMGKARGKAGGEAGATPPSLNLPHRTELSKNHYLQLAQETSRIKG